MKWSKTLVVLAGVLAIALGLARSGHAAQNNNNPDLFAACNQTALYDASTSGETKLITGNATSQIYVCGFDILASAGSINVDLVYGTGGSCGTGTTKITPAFQFTTSVGGIVDHLPVYTGLPAAPANNDVCLNASGAVAVQAIVYYAQF